MTQSALLHSTPRPRDVLLEQIRATGLALRAPAAAAGALAALATLFFLSEIVGSGRVIHFRPWEWILTGLAGLLLPIAVWRGEDRFSTAFLWTLPVDRRRHALIRVVAGWLWLMAGAALFLVWLLALTLVSGGSILSGETLRFIPSSPLEGTGMLDPSAVQTVPWTPQPLLWLVPFTAATATYLLGSALALGVTLRGIMATVGGLLVFLFAVAALGEATGSQWLIFAPSRLLRALFYGPCGLATLLTATSDFFTIRATLPTGEAVVLGRGAPDPARWALASVLWTGAGLFAVWFAASRHREKRRP